MTGDGKLEDNESLTDAASASRARVHTPGKHIVLFILAAAAIILSAASVVKKPSVFTSAKPMETVKAGSVHYVPLQEFLVDLSPDRNGRVTYLRLSASIVVDNSNAKKTIAALQTNLPAVEERASFLLRALRPEDFESSEGLERFKGELLRRVNLVIAPQEASDVVVNEIVIQ